MHREQILDLLWPTLAPEAAANNLHKALYFVRRTLEPELAPRVPSRFVYVRGDWIQLEARGGVHTDAQAFATAAKAALATWDPERCAEALALYVGDLLPEDRYEDWVIPHREHLRSLRLDVLLCFARLQASAGKLDHAADLLQRAAAIDPLNEECQVELIRVYGLSGQRHLAMQQYKQFAETILEELGVEPDAKTRALLQRIVDGEMQPIASKAPPTRVPSRNDAPITESLPCFGREAEVARAQEILDRLCDGEGGIMIVSGEDGIGKSRFTSEVVRYAQELDIHVARIRGIAVEDERVPEQWGEFSAPPTLAIVDDPIDLDRAVGSARQLVAERHGSAVLVLLSVRKDEAERNAPLGDLHALCSASGLSHTLDLNPLDSTAVELLVRRLLGGRVPPTLIDWIWSSVGGNPHYVGEAVESLLGRGALARIDGRWVFTAPPPITRDSLRRPPLRSVIPFRRSMGQ
jgi:DNA-binding SARP family transcriptional activator